jgi:dihydroorotase
MKIKINRPFDLHVHLRDGKMLERMVKHTSAHFGHALVMPNTTKPILTAEDAQEYKREICRIAALENLPHFTPLMTIKLVASTTPEIVRQASKAGVIAGKLYPEGVTTNSADGVSNFESLYPVFEAMQECDMVLCLHGEVPGVFVLDREAAFLKTLIDISRAFPNLRIVLEHVTTEEAVETVRLLPYNVSATITVHHLFTTLDDVIGGMLRPHLFCKPVAKTEGDRKALIGAAIGDSMRFFLGTDSAPHLVGKKECSSGCAGVFTAPVAMACLAEIFEQYGALERLQGFTSTFGRVFYRLPPGPGTLELVKEPWVVPAEYDGVVPFRAGETLPWKVL